MKKYEPYSFEKVFYFYFPLEKVELKCIDLVWKSVDYNLKQKTNSYI